LKNADRINSQVGGVILKQLQPEKINQKLRASEAQQTDLSLLVFAW
jgi:hypothetical protein